MRSLMNSMASMELRSDRKRRKIHMRLRVSLRSNRSSRRVEDAMMSTAGKMRLLDSLRSSCNSMFPVPLNSSKMTSSIFEDVSVRAVAMIVSEPPPSMFRAARKNFA